MKRTGIARTEFKRKPEHAKLRRGGKLNPVGRKGKANIAANRAIAKSRAGETRWCRLCSSTLNVHNSHDDKRRYLNDEQLRESTDLCDYPCHDFIEHVLDRDEQREVNKFLREHSDDEPGYKVEQLRKLMPAGKFEILRKRLGI